MPTVRGDCGYLKALWDSLSSCSTYFRFAACTACRKWSGTTWDLTDKRGLYSTKRTTMAKTKTTLSKRSFSRKKDTVNSEPSEDIPSGNDGITTLHGCTAGVKTHKGGSSTNEQTILSNPPGTGDQSPGSLHQALVTRHRAPVIRHQSPLTSHRA